MVDEHDLLKQVGEEAYARGELLGRIEGLIHEYELLLAQSGDEKVAKNMIEDLREIVNDD